MATHCNHPYHLVEKSPWPLVSSLGAMMLTTGVAYWFHLRDPSLLILGVASTALASGQWWRDISREGALQGLHTLKVVNGLRGGMALFIISEVCFFFSFFWSFFHSSLSPTLELGGVWPPCSINSFNPLQVPLLNTAILLASGVTVTWCHNSVLQGNHSQSVHSLALTILLGVYFSALQGAEYLEASFTISDSIYGAVFFVATGFHGLHVLVGSTLLLVNLIRMWAGVFSKEHHFGLEASIWYWHFVDVVWLFLYVAIYWWGG